MSMKLAGLLFCLFSFSTFAQSIGDQLEVASGTSHFDTVGSWFAQSTNVTLDSLRDGQLWSGRCFDRWNKDLATNIAFVPTQAKNDDGPGFPDSDEPLFIGMLVFPDSDNRDLPSDHFDNVTDFDRWRGVVLDAANAKNYLPASVDKDGVVSALYDFEPNNRPDLRYSVKQYQNYLVVEAYNLIDNNSMYSDSTGKLETKVPVGPKSYCYFFKKLMP
jgi:hypothetical protein